MNYLEEATVVCSAKTGVLSKQQSLVEAALLHQLHLVSYAL